MMEKTLEMHLFDLRNQIAKQILIQVGCEAAALIANPGICLDCGNKHGQ